MRKNRSVAKASDVDRTSSMPSNFHPETALAPCPELLGMAAPLTIPRLRRTASRCMAHGMTIAYQSPKKPPKPVLAWPG